MSWMRDIDPCGDGIDGCAFCKLYDLYDDCDYDCKYDLETGLLVSGEDE